MDVFDKVIVVNGGPSVDGGIQKHRVVHRKSEFISLGEDDSPTSSHVPGPDLRPLGVQKDPNVVPAAPRGVVLLHQVDHLLVRGVVAVRHVQAGDVHARIRQRKEIFPGARGWSDGAHNLSLPRQLLGALVWSAFPLEVVAQPFPPAQINFIHRICAQGAKLRSACLKEGGQARIDAEYGEGHSRILSRCLGLLIRGSCHCCGQHFPLPSGGVGFLSLQPLYTCVLRRVAFSTWCKTSSSHPQIHLYGSNCHYKSQK
mmetsp:Transcript_27374/g.37759  ORF Transcript_27374/g.37759 Transcript_27374/m.37759 type:complete len:257 (+) Transcript_27374:1344-2114(+)